ncbi:hypothetical protein ARMSODRAFT_1084308 [Armillaria solidipes]|uniref:Aminoglycoside phosphotransferase domain-containing protein n=1 Tax=Armillaria solidipes TaxID=1076256 RepID=A0A2H3BHF5_9AGAR|nr:hypothetical protein ARMSODRAFT_1084308 [Armillaria solidipes]
MEVLKSRIQGYLQDDDISLHSLDSFSNHVTYRVDSSFYGELLLRVAWAAVWSDGNRQYKEVSDFKMRSEVATMHYVKEHTTIPVPDVLFYDPDWDRKVGGEWMLMRYIDGINPVYLWRTLTDDQWETLCISIADIWSQLMRLRFKFVGSIYEQQESRYFIGPMTYLPQAGSIGSPEACTSGLFLSSIDWLIAIANEKLEPIRRTKPDPDDGQTHKWREASIDALKKSPPLNSDSRNHEQIVLSHIDYSLHNILVDRDDPTRVVAVVDWEGARTVPMWAANPTFRWPFLLSNEKVSHLQRIMRERIVSQIPGWKFTIGNGGDVLRLLQARAEFSDCDPSIYDTGRPIQHKMSWIDVRCLIF